MYIHWSQYVTNAEISSRAGLPPVMDFIRRRRLSVFGHIVRLTQGTSAHNALHCQVGLASGRSLGRDWRRRPGRPRARWTDRPTPQRHWICSCQPLETESYRAMVERRRDGPSSLRDDDDDDSFIHSSFCTVSQKRTNFETV